MYCNNHFFIVKNYNAKPKIANLKTSSSKESFYETPITNVPNTVPIPTPASPSPAPINLAAYKITEKLLNSYLYTFWFTFIFKLMKKQKTSFFQIYYI